MASGNDPEIAPSNGSREDTPPGTFLLIRENEEYMGHLRAIMLSPFPSTDPNEPLNWSTTRKALNFTLVLAVTCLIFTALSIQAIFWQLMVVDLNVTYTELNRVMSVNFVGLAVGCVFFIPLAKKFGRRPVYLVSTALMLITSFWTAELHSLSELYVANLLQGLAGATNEAIVQITIADLFFVHQRGRMNALYMSMMMIGSFLTPMAAGTQATRQGWRMPYRTLGICNAIVFVLFIVFYEETKYTRTVEETQGSGAAADGSRPSVDTNAKDGGKVFIEGAALEETNTRYTTATHEIDNTIPVKPWLKRLPMYTYTAEPIWPHYYRPFIILVSFPAVLCCALQYACGVMWLTVMSSVLALVFPMPPYSFTPEQVGFMSVGPFIGNLIGSFYGGFVGDRTILHYARRNRGYYEPEMRLYILHIPALALCAGIIMFGVTIDRGMHWMLPSIGGALFGFGLGSISDACLTWVIDCYMEITGDAFTGVAFMRNAVSIGIPFAITPWMQKAGLTNMFITCGFISLGVTLIMVPMIFYGKSIRRTTAKRYLAMAAKQD